MVATGQEYRLWFSEDLRDQHEDNNVGPSCTMKKKLFTKKGDKVVWKTLTMATEFVISYFVCTLKQICKSPLAGRSLHSSPSLFSALIRYGYVTRSPQLIARHDRRTFTE